MTRLAGAVDGVIGVVTVGPDSGRVGLGRRGKR